MDECKTFVCAPSETCLNTVGGYRCICDSPSVAVDQTCVVPGWLHLSDDAPKFADAAKSAALESQVHIQNGMAMGDCVGLFYYYCETESTHHSSLANITVGASEAAYKGINVTFAESLKQILAASRNGFHVIRIQSTNECCNDKVSEVVYVGY